MLFSADQYLRVHFTTLSIAKKVGVWYTGSKTYEAEENFVKNFSNIDFQKMRERETQLLKELDELKHLCFGMYARVPANLDTLTDNEAVMAVCEMSKQLAQESVGDSKNDEKYRFFRAFYQAVIFYLLDQCNEVDQILLSVRKIAATYDADNFEPASNTTFHYMMDNIRNSILNGRESVFATNCINSYQEFEECYEHQMEPTNFFNVVRNGLNSYADKQAYSCIADEDVFNRIISVVNEACNEVYFTVYQGLEE